MLCIAHELWKYFSYFSSLLIQTFFFCRKPECPIDREDLGAQVGEQTTNNRLVPGEPLSLVTKNDDDMSQTLPKSYDLNRVYITRLLKKFSLLFNMARGTKTSRDFVAALDCFAKPKELALLDLCCESETCAVDLWQVWRFKTYACGNEWRSS